MAYKKTVTKTLNSVLADTPVIDFSEQDGGMFRCSAAVQLTLYHCDTKDGTFEQVKTLDPRAPSSTPVAFVFTPEASIWYQWPETLNAGLYYKVVAASGTPTLKVTMKKASR